MKALEICDAFRARSPASLTQVRASLALLAHRHGCPVCGDPTGIRCCEFGADR